MAEPSSASPASTFVVRFWRESVADGARWRGYVTHVQSGARVAFLTLESLLDFVQEFGVMAEDAGWAAAPEGAEFPDGRSGT